MRRRREPFRSLGLRRSATVIDWMIASVRTISRSSKFSSCCFMPPRTGQHAEHLLDRPGAAELLHLREEVLERELLGRELLGDLAGLLLVEGLLGLLDEGEDVAEVEDAARHAIGVERLEVVEALTGRREDDGSPGDGRHARAPRRRGRRRRASTARRR